MKKKILSILLSLVFIFACAFSVTLFASCDDPGEGNPNEQESKPPWGLGEMPIQ